MVRTECVCKLVGLVAWYVSILSLTPSPALPLLPTFVLVNGLVCHGTAHPACIAWDVVANAAVVAWINVHTAWQPHSLVCTALLLGAYATSCATRHPVVRTLLHVLLVQGLASLLVVQYRAAPTTASGV
jgi:hypothetical protein